MLKYYFSLTKYFHMENKYFYADTRSLLSNAPVFLFRDDASTTRTTD
jgi:hypothetical protein